MTDPYAWYDNIALGHPVVDQLISDVKSAAGMGQ